MSTARHRVLAMIETGLEGDELAAVRRHGQVIPLDLCTLFVPLVYVYTSVNKEAFQNIN